MDRSSLRKVEIRLISSRGCKSVLHDVQPPPRLHWGQWTGLHIDRLWAPTHALTNPLTEVVDHSAATSILAAGLGA
jgi:hypothetical protein